MIDVMWVRMLLIAVLLTGMVSRGAAAPPDSWDTASRLYGRGEFQAAARQYELLLARGYTGVALFNNLGACYSRMGELGRARLAFERGIRFYPEQKSFRAHLNRIKPRLADTYLEEASVPGVWPHLKLLDRLPVSRWLILGLVSWYLAILGLTLGKQPGFHFLVRRQWVSWIVAVVAWLIVGVGLTRWYQLRDDKAAIVLPAESPLYLAPDARSPVVRTLHSGLRVQIASADGNWKKINLPNGDEGWIADKDIEQVYPVL